MIKFENIEVIGWKAAIRGARNPMNSWDKSDSTFFVGGCADVYHINDEQYSLQNVEIGPNDHKLLMNLAKAGTDHRKYLRMINVTVDITSALYWWKEFDTYKVGTTSNSCSTMHKICAKEFTLDDFSHDRLTPVSINTLDHIIKELEWLRNAYNHYDERVELEISGGYQFDSKKQIWEQIIQLLPSSYNQKRTVQMNYEVLSNIYKSRKNHKLTEWSVGFMEFIKNLPYSELITGKYEE